MSLTSRYKKGHIEQLASSVLTNALILDNIFSNYKAQQCLRFRLVCKSWKSAIDSKCSKEVIVNLSSIRRINSRETCTNITERSITVLRVLNISKIRIEFEENDFLKEKLQITSVYLTVQEIGANLKYIALHKTFHTKYDWPRLRKILDHTPNLEMLETDLTVNVPPFCKSFAEFCHPRLKRLLIFGDVLAPLEGDTEKFVKQVVKCFPNLETNLKSCDLDYQLFKIIKENKAPIHLKRVRIRPKAFWEGQGLELLKELPANRNHLSELEVQMFRNCDQNLADTITNVLKNFAQTLKSINLLSGLSGVQYSFTLSLPKLPTLRKMCLGIASLEDGEPFYWKLRESRAEDFPLLEYLILKPRYVHSTSPAHGGIFYSIKDSWRFWEPFVPFVDGESDADFSRLKSLKYVNLSIPKEWIGLKENVKWGKKFLQAYRKIYGNAGKEPVRNIIDWICKERIIIPHD